MPTVQVNAPLGINDLLKAAGQLNERELLTLETGLRQIRARLQTSLDKRSEANLMRLVKDNWPQQTQARYEELISRRDADVLTEAERAELVALGDEQEELWAARLAAAAELSRRRGTKLPDLMRQLGMAPAGTVA